MKYEMQVTQERWKYV